MVQGYSIKVKNSRIVPTEEKYLSDKKFSMEVYLKFQAESNGGGENHRYIKKENVNISRFAREVGVSRITFKKQLNYLKEIKLIKETRDNQYYKIKNNFEKYILLDVNFINELLNVGEKNLLKTYVLYYSFSMYCGNYNRQKSDTLRMIGLSPVENNKGMIKSINDKLKELELIDIHISFHNGKKRLTIVAPVYIGTQFYENIGKDKLKTSYIKSSVI